MADTSYKVLQLLQFKDDKVIKVKLLIIKNVKSFLFFKKAAVDRVLSSRVRQINITVIW